MPGVDGQKPCDNLDKASAELKILCDDLKKKTTALAEAETNVTNATATRDSYQAKVDSKTSELGKVKYKDELTPALAILQANLTCKSWDST